SKKYKIHLNVYRFQALIGEGRIEEERVILAKPLTFVNEAGRSLYQIKEGYQIEPSKMIIISDDVDLKLGKLRIASKGGDGGHKGLRSIIESLQTREIPRLRVGIGRPEGEMELRDYVLEEFTPPQRQVIEEAIERASQAIRVMITQGIQEAMREYN
ncbi:aminoacyl-tRNA hydrolase, partial [Candidatus Aerophobetes bacterium]